MVHGWLLSVRCCFIISVIAMLFLAMLHLTTCSSVHQGAEARGRVKQAQGRVKQEEGGGRATPSKGFAQTSKQRMNLNRS